MNLENLDESEKFIVKWQYGRLGCFEEELINAIMIADDKNLGKLRLGFPIEVDGYINYTQTPGWWKKVQTKAEIEPF